MTGEFEVLSDAAFANEGIEIPGDQVSPLEADPPSRRRASAGDSPDERQSGTECASRSVQSRKDGTPADAAKHIRPKVIRDRDASHEVSENAGALLHETPGGEVRPGRDRNRISPAQDLGFHTHARMRAEPMCHPELAHPTGPDRHGIVVDDEQGISATAPKFPRHVLGKTECRSHCSADLGLGGRSAGEREEEGRRTEGESR